MTRKTKKVRCWLVEWQRDRRIDQAIYKKKWAAIAVGQFYGNYTITPGHFVPDEPKRKARRK